MKNQLSFILVLLVIAIVALGCGRLNPFSSDSGSSSNKSIKDTAVDTVVGEKKIGVPECDEVMDAITAELNNPDDDFVTKAVKATILNRIKDGIKESVDKNPNDKVELAKTCKEFKTQFDIYKAEQQAKENE